MSKRDELDRERYLIDMHLLCKLQSDKLLIQAKRLANLSEFYKEAGYYTDAVCEIKRALRISGDNDYEAVLTELEKEIGLSDERCPYCFVNNYSQNANNFCPECNRMITVCSKCDAPNRLFDPYCRYCGLEFPKSSNTGVRIGNFVLDWFHPISFEYLSPSPSIVGDLVLVPFIKEKSLLALKMSNGDIAWNLNRILPSDEHIKLHFCYPYLYIFSTKKTERIMMELEAKNSETIYSNPDSFTSYPSFPIIDETNHAMIFPLNKGLLVHDTWRKRGNYFHMDIEKDDCLYPVATETDQFIFTKHGKINKVSRLYHSIPNCKLVSPPVFSNESNCVYFETFLDGQRMINAWLPGTETILSKKLPESLCVFDDLHFHVPPFLYKDGVLLISCQEPLVYYAKNIGNDIDIKEIPININMGSVKVFNIEYLFTLVTEPYLVSRIANGFFYINLDDATDYGIEFFGSEMVSKPIVFNKNLLLLCKDGVRCYTF